MLQGRIILVSIIDYIDYFICLNPIFGTSLIVQA